MSSQPFRLVRPLSCILHNTLLQRLGEPDCVFGLTEIDALFTHSTADHVNHFEMCEALTGRLAAVHQRGDAVFSSDGLFFPLRGVRRCINAIQRFPNTTDTLEAAKRNTEKAVLHDVLRLSNDDITSKDVTQLWSIAMQLSRWDFVEELLRQFPLQQTLNMLDGQEYRELILWACMCNQVTSLTDEKNSISDASLVPLAAGKGVSHTQRFLTDVLGIDEAVAQCRKALAESATAAHSSVSGETRPVEDRESLALLCSSLTVALHRRCGVSVDFPVSEAEWQQWFSAPTSSSRSRDVTAQQQGGMKGILGGSGSSDGTSIRITATPATASLVVWLRRLLVVCDPLVPPYVRASLAPSLTKDLQRAYHNRDMPGACFFFFLVLPMLSRANPSIELLRHAQEYHNRVIQEMFWTVAATPTTRTATARTSASTSTPGKRGKWTVKALTDGDAAPATPAATSLYMSVETSLITLLGEMCFREETEPLMASHVPAIEAMLSTVLSHLRPHLRGALRKGGKTAAEQLPLSLWKAWQQPHSACLAVVVDHLLKAAAVAQGNSSNNSSASSSDAGGVMAVAATGYPELDRLTAEALEMLRLLLDVSVMQERGTAAVVTTLLTFGREAVHAMGGAAYEAQLRAIVQEHAMDGFTRDGMQAMARTALQQSHSESDGEKQRTAEFVRQLEADQLRLPPRHWVF